MTSTIGGALSAARIPPSTVPPPMRPTRDHVAVRHGRTRFGASGSPERATSGADRTRAGGGEISGGRGREPRGHREWDERGCVVRSSGEDADTTWPDQQADDDQHDAPQQLPPEDGEDAGDHEDD